MLRSNGLCRLQLNVIVIFLQMFYVEEPASEKWFCTAPT